MNTVRRQPALFLDRDGVINVEKNYVHRIEDFEFVPGIFELCAVATELGLCPVVVTNQAGIGRGYYTEADFQALTTWMLERFRERGIEIGAVYHCPYHPTAGVGEYRRESFDRKPNPGMFLRARDELGLDMAGSILVGDKASDIEAGRAAGVGTLIKLTDDAKAKAAAPSGHGSGSGHAPDPAAGVAADVIVVRSLDEAAVRLGQIVGGIDR
jgi:D-glycero-D-manno-heptose 1,7-bisphosphate phosphatase